MKKTLRTITFVFLSICIFSTITFGQTDPGGSGTGSTGGTGTGGTGDGGGTITPPPAPLVYTFKRNNGNGLGVCGGDAQIRVAFNPMPTDYIPTITEIWYNNGTTNTKITSVQLPVNGDWVDKTQPYVSYCLTGILPSPGNSQGNIPPAVKLTLVFGHPVILQSNAATGNGIDITE